MHNNVDALFVQIGKERVDNFIKETLQLGMPEDLYKIAEMYKVTSPEVINDVMAPAIINNMTKYQAAL